MFAKLAVIFGVIAAAHAGLYGSTALGYAASSYGTHGYGSGYGSGYYGVSPYASYSAPIVKTVAPVAYAAPVAYTAPVAYAPAVSSVSQYSVHSAPVIKSYAPVGYTSYASPYLSHAYSPAVSYGNYGYGYSGYGGKYAW